MAKYKLEYIWLDGYKPEPNMRSKTKIIDSDDFPSLDKVPEWSFDGSSTEQAEGQFFRLLVEAGENCSETLSAKMAPWCFAKCWPLMAALTPLTTAARSKMTPICGLASSKNTH